MTDAAAAVAVVDLKAVPTEHVGTIEPNYYCRGWNAKRAHYCRARAGMGTDHPGQGRCKFHGGASPITHGMRRRYAGIKHERIRDLVEQFEADPDPLNLLSEVALLRAIALDFIERYQSFSDALIAWHESFQTGPGVPKPVRVLDLADGYRIVDATGKMVERIENIRSQNAISRPELNRIMQELWRSLDGRLTDDDVKAAIREDWLRIRL